MKVLFNWLRDFVDLDESPEMLAETLTELGLEVEALVPTASLFDGIVVGKVLDCEPIGSDRKLLRCSVSLGDRGAGGRARTLTTVCGDLRLEAGKRVPVALPGAVLEGGAVRVADVAGTMSEAVLCSLYDMGLRSVQDEVHAFDGSPDLGSPVAGLLDLEDTLVEIELTPNRGDCLSLLGLAREIAAAKGVRVRLPEPVLQESDRAASERARIDIEANDLCSRYIGRVVENVTVGPSPLRLTRRLRLMGIRPINNVVDIANYVMLELGQPLHTFDHRFLKDGRILIRRATAGEKFEALDETQHTLDPETLVIADGERVVAVAGVMGGTNSGVVEDTETILIESAHFDPVSVRKSARRMGLSTEASMRFERGIDPEGVGRAADRTAELLADLAGGTVLAGRIDAGTGTERAKPISLRVARANTYLGLSLESGEMSDLLRRLEFEVSEEDGRLLATPPSYRNDISMEADLFEEVARLYGYSHIPAAFSGYGGEPPRKSHASVVVESVRDILSGLGLDEAVTATLVESRESRTVGRTTEEDLELLCLRNPLSVDQSVLRPSLLPGLLSCVRINRNRRRENVRLFEIGTVFSVGQDRAGRPVETRHVSGVLAGLGDPILWETEPKPVGFFDLKGLMEDLCRGLRLGPLDQKRHETPLLDPESSVEWILDSEPVGIGGKLEAKLADSIGLREPVFVFELILDRIVDKALQLQAIKDVPRYPAISRDLAIVLEADIPFVDVSRLIRSGGEPLLVGFHLFDVYRGKQIPKEKKSLAYSLIFRSDERTLRDEEVDGKLARIVEGLGSELGARLRSEV